MDWFIGFLIEEESDVMSSVACSFSLKRLRARVGNSPGREGNPGEVERALTGFPQSSQLVLFMKSNSQAKD